MAGRFKPLVAIVASGSLFFSSTAAVAAQSGAPLPQPINPWAALAVMSSTSSATALCGASAAAGVAAGAAAAAQPAAGCVLPAVDGPPAVVQSEPPPPVPVPPVAPAGGGFGISPILLALGALAAGIAAYFLLKKDKDNDDDISPT